MVFASGDCGGTSGGCDNISDGCDGISGGCGSISGGCGDISVGCGDISVDFGDISGDCGGISDGCDVDTVGTALSCFLNCLARANRACTNVTTHCFVPSTSLSFLFVDDDVFFLECIDRTK